AAKARGKRLGNPKLSEARRHASAAKKESADSYSANVLPVIREIQNSGVKTLRGVARALAARGIPTARGGAWTPVQVSAILRRAGGNLFAVGVLIDERGNTENKLRQYSKIARNSSPLPETALSA